MPQNAAAVWDPNRPATATPATSGLGPGVSLLGRTYAEARGNSDPGDPIPGVPRPQRHQVTMSLAVEYADGLPLDGRRVTVANRPATGALEIRMMPWKPNYPTRWPESAPTDDGNPPPVRC
jgi:hypothetical protein